MINFLIRVFNKLRILKYFNFSVSASLQKKKFIIPVIRGLGKENLDISEKWMLKVFEKLMPLKNGFFMDVGVNTGQTLLKLKATDDQRKYIGFEPNPNCIFYVQELIRVNKFTDVTLYPVGLASKTQLIELNYFTNDATDSAASIITDFRKGATVYRKEFIPCFLFSDIILSLSESIAIIKIDVEGAELEVFEGLKEVIQQYRPFIIIEVLPVYDLSNGDRFTRQKAIESLLSELDYKIIRILKRGDSEVEKYKLLSEIGVHANMDYCDYIFCPGEFLDKLL